MSSIPPEYDVDDDERAELARLADLEDVTAAVDTFKALTDPLRVAVLRMLSVGGPICVCVLVEILDVEYSKLSYHLKILREAGLVATERDGNFAEYRLTERGRQATTILEGVLGEDDTTP